LNITGGCVIDRLDDGRPVVVKADPILFISRELVELWRTGTGETFTVEHTENGDVVRCGTPGEGLGVVAYRIGETFADAGPVPLRRIA
jgi:hypothetical protein